MGLDGRPMYAIIKAMDSFELTPGFHEFTACSKSYEVGDEFFLGRHGGAYVQRYRVIEPGRLRAIFHKSTPVEGKPRFFRAKRFWLDGSPANG